MITPSEFLKWLIVFGLPTGGGGGGAAIISGVQQNSYNYSTDTGVDGTAYVGALTPAITAYNDGMRVTLLAANSNTIAAPTLDMNGVGAVPIVTRDNQPLPTGAIVAGRDMNFMYNAGLGSFVLLNDLTEKLPIAGGTLTGALTLAGNAAAALQPVTLQQLQAAILNETLACYVAEPTVDAFATWTYDNGAGGVGATLTAPANGATTFDGLASGSTDGKRLFVAFENSNPERNGIYDITQGTGGTPTVLTRAADFDQGSNINFGDVLTVVLGDTRDGTFWQVSAEVTTVGTDPITFQQLQNTGALLKANNLSDLDDVPTARTNLGLSSMSLQAANSVAITGGSGTFTELRYLVNYSEIVGDISLAAADANEAFVATAGGIDIDADVGLAAFSSGFMFYIKNQAGSNITFTPKAGEFIDGATELVIEPNQAFAIMKTDTEWAVVSDYGTAGGSLSQSMLLMGG